MTAAVVGPAPPVLGLARLAWGNPCFPRAIRHALDSDAAGMHSPAGLLAAPRRVPYFRVGHSSPGASTFGEVGRY
jgi:hypothetical protein